ncbi:hypothetical protein KIN20_033728 [Parelaphostrongylus tenuis]|uniref:Uncharacterized protein n=1 Tax=Parelaphostrongylus tenuis TaxID=148309 RepID=A0AAD5R932_PARTN|nr:hypothetical protein KIN20_033728 [Parelaphostrongylus tenuis]
MTLGDLLIYKSLFFNEEIWRNAFAKRSGGKKAGQQTRWTTLVGYLQTFIIHDLLSSLQASESVRKFDDDGSASKGALRSPSLKFSGPPERG